MNNAEKVRLIGEAVGWDAVPDYMGGTSEVRWCHPDPPHAFMEEPKRVGHLTALGAFHALRWANSRGFIVDITNYSIEVTPPNGCDLDSVMATWPGRHFLSPQIVRDVLAAAIERSRT